MLPVQWMLRGVQRAAPFQCADALDAKAFDADLDARALRPRPTGGPAAALDALPASEAPRANVAALAATGT